MFEERLQLLASYQIRGMRSRDLGDVRAQHRDRVEDERARIDGAFPNVRSDPRRRQTVDWFALDLRREPSQHRLIGHREQPLEIEPSAAGEAIANAKTVRARVARKIVT